MTKEGPDDSRLYTSAQIPLFQACMATAIGGVDHRQLWRGGWWVPPKGTPVFGLFIPHTRRKKAHWIGDTGALQ